MAKTRTTSTERPAVGREVPLHRRILWGLGGGADGFIYNGVNGLVDQIYVVAMQFDPRWISLARAIPRLLDFVTDPLVGHLSDNTTSRWGRRRPWMLAGALISALVCVAMWYPPVALGPVAVQAFILGMLVLLFTFGYAMFTIPYTAMGYELSTDYNERTHIFQWRMYAFAATGFLTPWLPKLCLMFEGDKAEVLKGASGVHTVSFIVAGIILLSALAPILGCREHSIWREGAKVRFLDAVRFTFNNKAFWPLVIGNFFVKFGMCLTGVFFYYVLLYHVGGGNMSKGTTAWGIFANVINISTCVAMLPMVKLSDWLGKKQAVVICMAGSAVAYATVWWTLTPATPYLSLVTAASIGIFTNTMPMVVNSMLADVCDVDELNTGHRRQAFYSAVFVTCDKMAMAVALALQGVLLKASGFDASLAVQSAETVASWMKMLLYTQPTGFILGLICVLFYPITRAHAMATRRELDRRQAEREMSA
jgi:GPH family glycoside/pentoside/hexuronide:cation symporter